LVNAGRKKFKYKRKNAGRKIQEIKENCIRKNASENGKMPLEKMQVQVGKY